MFKLDLNDVFVNQVHMIDVANIGHGSEIPFLNTATGDFQVFTVVKFDEKSIAVQDKDCTNRWVMKPIADVSFDECYAVILYSIIVDEELHAVALHQLL